MEQASVDVIDGKKIQEKYLRKEMMPTIFCDGCGIGNVLDYTLWAIEREGIDMDNTVFLSGIGCSSRLPGYVDVDALHTTHGRALAFATGVKLTNPDLHVVVFTGDGDGIGIGGNHFIHACRRNLDATVICVNNFIYGMTGGQVAPTTPETKKATTAPYGNIEPPFDMSKMAIASGASYVARWPINKPSMPINSIREGLRNPGFSFIEMLSPCPTAYGRRNKFRKIDEMWTWYAEHTMLIEDYEMIQKYGGEEEKTRLRDVITMGVLHREEKPSLSQRHKHLIEEVMIE
ncbi:MAG: thiamine pyrophosphate-dependent enzyme [Thermoplasmatota archaeon]